MNSHVFAAIALVACISCVSSLETQEEHQGLVAEQIRSWRGPITCNAIRIGTRSAQAKKMLFCDDGTDRHEIVGISDELSVKLNEVDYPLPLSGEDVLFEESSRGKRVDLSKGNVSIDEERRLETENYFALAVTAGIRKVLAIRVSTIGATPTNTAANMVTKIFATGPNDPDNLVTQIDSCSYSVTTIVPATELKVNSGVLDLKVNRVAAGNGAPDIVNAARAGARLEIDDLDIYDHVMYCLPTGTSLTPQGSTVADTTWTSYGDIRGPESVYNDAACVHLTEQMSSFGLNFGLDNANIDQTEGVDGSGYMGTTKSTSTDARKCYNAYHSYRLGWYANRHSTYLARRWTSYVGENNGRITNLVPITQYKVSSRYHTVIAKIPLIQMQGALYIYYNKADGFNDGAETSKNEVAVSWGSYLQQSVLLGSLAQGESFSWSSFNGGLETLEIKVLSMVSAGIPDTASVSFTVKYQYPTNPAPP
eukprot:CAMPEP_0171313432 /NCGR_PEP_ID=MMETSP0816-20121228/42118_1 /TAXON_ID=420281 /ORGANISM="Proboscia inermis, Strain CCAP1064/1" /LENGTH=478 /DNA_ID=CAMNT_0011800821 /DNA_START=30 /DNA_END=1469 /DNA_ORIENTATION=+